MCYFGIIFKDLSSVVDVVAHQFNDPILERVNLLVGIGLSGTMPLLSIRERTGIEVIALHKPKSMSHAQVLWEVNSLGWDVNNPPESYDHRYVILDDFVGQGNTVRAIQETSSATMRSQGSSTRRASSPGSNS